MLDDLISFFVPLFIIIAILVSIFLSITYFGTIYECNGYSKATGKTTKVVSMDCYIEDQGNWYQWAEYKNRFVARGKM